MNLPRLRRDQYEIAVHPAKVKVVNCGRRWGKSVLGGAIAGICLAHGLQAAWVTPTYANSRPLWRWVVNACADDLRAKRMSVNRSERILESRQGGLLAMFSGENVDAIRSWNFDLVILDEAARLPEFAWTDAIMPTLADTDGDALMVSTPKGKNWYYTEYMRGVAGDPLYRSWSYPTWSNPNPKIQRAAELAKTRVPELTYLQEWAAQFVEAGLVFRRVRESAHAEPQAYKDYNLNHQYVVGVDWGKHNDYSVFAVVDATLRHLVYLDRSNQVDYTVQADRLVALCKRFAPQRVIAEANAMGEANIEQVRQVAAQREAHVPIEAYTTTNAGKATLVEHLQNAFEYGEIQVIPDPILLAELQAYEAARLPSGLMRYAAPEGMHDDCVMALLLAWEAARTPEMVVQHKARPMAR